MSTFWTSATVMGATLTTGLTAGLLLAFAHSVMPGLSTLGDADYLRGFQRIDAAIANPWMGLTFVGSPVLVLAALLLHVRDGGATLVWLGTALTLIIVTVAITTAVHLPLNAQVQAAAPTFTSAAALRVRWEDRWVTWNVIRTGTSVGSFFCLCVALFLTGSAA